MSDINGNIVNCYKCQKPLEIEERTKIMRGDECPHCETSLRCCRMCLHFETSAYNSCRESIAERILDKEKANFCNYFVFADNISNKSSARENQMLSADSLFKK